LPSTTVLSQRSSGDRGSDLVWVHGHGVDPATNS